MNLENFDCRSIEEQLEFMRDQGTYLLTRQGRKGPIRLYYAESYFVEVWFASEYTSVKMVRAFNCTTLLEPYLSRIQVLELIANLK